MVFFRFVKFSLYLFNLLKILKKNVYIYVFDILFN